MRGHPGNPASFAVVNLLIIDDFTIRDLATIDFYEIVVERDRRKSTIISSNREPAEGMAQATDSLLSQSAIDRLTQGVHTLPSKAPPDANAPQETSTPLLTLAKQDAQYSNQR